MSQIKQLTIGTRKSKLAQWQAQTVAALIEQRYPKIKTKLKFVLSSGDKDRQSDFQSMGAVGVFTRECEQALLDHEVDLVVHSLKDLPTQMRPGLALSAILPRENPADVLCGGTVEDLVDGARLGTCSIRRQAQILAMNPNVVIKPLRGNVPTRLQKIKKQEGMELTLLAYAGLKRLEMLDQVAMTELDPKIFPYAVAQGAVCVQIRQEDKALSKLLEPLDHYETRVQVEAERVMLHALDAGCSLPVGVHSQLVEGNLLIEATVTAHDGSQQIKASASAPMQSYEQLGLDLAKSLIGQGADKLLRDCEAQIQA